MARPDVRRPAPARSGNGPRKNVRLASNNKSDATSRWRNQYRVHPAADVFPMMSEEEVNTLGEDIKARAPSDTASQNENVTTNVTGVTLNVTGVTGVTTAPGL